MRLGPQQFGLASSEVPSQPFKVVWRVKSVEEGRKIVEGRDDVQCLDAKGKVQLSIKNDMNAR